VAELADALGSGSSGRKAVRVRVPPSAPKKYPRLIVEVIMKKLTHIDKKGRARMVDVGGKQSTEREAIAQGSVYMRPETLALIQEDRVPKGDVFSVARIAGIMAAKKTSELIPLCHPLNITSVSIDLSIDTRRKKIEIVAKVKVTGQTGVEMEALTAVSASALAIYDMCKAVDRDIVISDIMLMEKKGGRSGTFKRK
jgi:cyclic pyranopterin monophosphate synthase